MATFRLLFLFVLVADIFSCSTPADNKEIHSTAVYVHDTIVVHDTTTTGFLQTVFLKNDNHEEAILPVDSVLQKCMHEKARSTTPGMITCYRTASEQLMVKIYNREKQLIAMLSPADAETLKKSQEKWRTYYELEKKFLSDTYETWPNSYELGREAAIDQAEWAYLIVRNRYIALDEYYQARLQGKK